MVSSQHNVCRLLMAMHGIFTKDTRRAMEPALTTLGHSTTRTEWTQRQSLATWMTALHWGNRDVPWGTLVGSWEHLGWSQWQTVLTRPIHSMMKTWMSWGHSPVSLLISLLCCSCRLQPANVHSYSSTHLLYILFINLSVPFAIFFSSWPFHCGVWLWQPKCSCPQLCQHWAITCSQRGDRDQLPTERHRPWKCWQVPSKLHSWHCSITPCSTCRKWNIWVYKNMQTLLLEKVM